MEDKLYSIAEEGDLEALKIFLADKLFSNSCTTQALLCAMRKGHLSIVKYLIEEARTFLHIFGDLPLQMAVSEGQLHIVKYFQTLTDIDLHMNKDSLIIVAAKSGNMVTLKYLKSQGLSLFAHNHGAVIGAVESGNLRMLKYLKRQGLNLHTNNDYAINSAAEKGHLHIANYLKKEGFSMKVWGIIEFAIYDKHYHMISYFINNGAKYKPLSDAWDLKYSQYLEIEQKFLSHVHPLVYDFPLYRLDKEIAVKKKRILKHGVMEMIYCTIEIPLELVLLLAEAMLGKKFNPREFDYIPLPTPLNLDIKERIAEYNKTYNKLTSTWLALIECNCSIGKH